MSAHTIPPARDRLQSRILVCIAVPILCWLTVSTFLPIVPFSGRYLPAFGRNDTGLVSAITVSLLFALAVWRLRAATATAAAAGGLICFLITAMSERSGGTSVTSGLTPLLLLFLLTFWATRLGRAKKAAAGLAESRKGRSAAQVIANLGIAAIIGSRFGWGLISLYGQIGSCQCELEKLLGLLFIPTLAALAEATADTVSSEIGQAFGGTPFLLTTLRRVPPGTDGAITALGTLAGIAAAALVAVSAAAAMDMPVRQCAVAFAAGIAGLFFDSLLGATVERKGWLGNDLVNFLSTAFSAVLGIVAIRLLPRYLLF